MKLTLQNFVPYFILVVLGLPLLTMYVLPDHAWGDDFAGYLLEAKSIVAGQPFYKTPYVFNGANCVYAPPQYPIGFPLMLAPLVAQWGLDFKVFCIFNSVLAIALLLALYQYFKQYMPALLAAGIGLLVSYSGFMVDMKRNVLADTPCLLLMVGYLTLRAYEQQTWGRKLGAIILLILATQMRSQAIFILLAEVGWLGIIWIKQIIKSRSIGLTYLLGQSGVAVTFGVACIHMLLQATVLHTPISTSAFYAHFLQLAFNDTVPHLVQQHINYVFTTIVAYVQYPTYSPWAGTVMTIIGKIFLWSTFIGWIYKLWIKAGMEDLFFIVMCVLILFYPVRDPRYFMPALPLLYVYNYYTFLGVVRLLKTRLQPAWGLAPVAFTLLLGIPFLVHTTKEGIPGCIPQKNDYEAYSALNKIVQPTDVVIFTKPRLLSLFTERKSVNVSWQQGFEDNKKTLDALGANYLLIVAGLDDAYFKSYLQEVSHPIDSLQLTYNYTLYRLK